MRIQIPMLLTSTTMAIAASGQPSNISPPPPAIDASANAFVIKFKVKAGKNKAFERAMSDVLLGVRTKEPGNVYSDLLHLARDDQTYLIVERYKDHEAAVEHSRSSYIERVGEIFKSEELLEGPPEVQELVFIRAK